MSTNFYMSRDGKDETIHLGKRAGGWSFLFKGSEPDNIHDFKSWYISAKKHETHGYKLINDNGSDEQNLKDLLKEIKRLIPLKQHAHLGIYYDEQGHCFYDGEFS